MNNSGLEDVLERNTKVLIALDQRLAHDGDKVAAQIEGLRSYIDHRTSNLEVRVASLEVRSGAVEERITELRADMRAFQARTDARIDDLQRQLTSSVRWLVGLHFATLLAIAGLFFRTMH
jgi:hypothetical protein